MRASARLWQLARSRFLFQHPLTREVAVWSFSKPDTAELQRLLTAEAKKSLTYSPVGISADASPPGYDIDENRVLLGHGPECFAAACEALRQWHPFPAGWTAVWPARVPLAVGESLVMMAHVFGLWWINCCRIVYVVDEPLARFGFAYGTLPRHVEQGEERFLVEHLPDDSVWYSIRAVSRPRYWMVRLAYRLARRLQKRFARDSKVAMQQAVKESPR